MRRVHFLFTILLILTIFISACSKLKQSGETEVKPDSEYIEYISEYTSGRISAVSEFRIQLARGIELDDTNSRDGMTLKEDILQFSPKISGEARWENNRTIVFTPEKSLPSGKKYQASLDLTKLFPDVPESLAEFTSNFSVITQDFEVTIREVSFSQEGINKYQNISGQVVTADVISSDDLEKIISLKNNKDNLKITWSHFPDEKKSLFEVNKIRRADKNYFQEIEWNGAPINVSDKGSTKVEIFNIHDFRYLKIDLVRSPDKYLDIIFSMPLDEKQDLSGIITVDGDKRPRFIIDNNTIRLYPSESHKDELNITINKAIKDASGSQLPKDVSFTIAFTQQKPQVRWLRKNSGIIPGSGTVLLPFEAVSLSAVDVTVVEIYENNIVQFFQNNKDITGRSQIKKVGRPVAYKTFSLQDKVTGSLTSWNRFNLDISELVKIKPGSIYQVRINFRPSFSLYECDSREDAEVLQNLDNMAKISWDAPQRESYYYYDDDHYNYSTNYRWRDRDNPSKPAYYGSRRRITMNILGSNLGIIARGSDMGQLNVFVSNVLDTSPEQGVQILAFNYQNQQIGSAKTDSDGRAVFELSQTPFLIVAKKGDERGYLKVDDPSSLSMSNFDVGGTQNKKGIKGFLYGERGVWRPGDTMYLNFILEDKKKTLPEGHPVIFELLDPKGRMEERIVRTEHTGGIYNFTCATDPEAPTGNWRAQVRVGTELFSKKIKIETVKPNRLKIDLDFHKERLSVQDKTIRGDLEVKWLHGAPGKNMKTEYDLILSPMKTSFKDYFAYTFDDPSRQFTPDQEQIFSGTTDSEGKTFMNVAISGNRNSPGALRATFIGKVYEQGGNFSIDKLTIPYYPYKSFAGIKLPSEKKNQLSLLPEKEYKVDIATVDSYGKPISRENVNIEVYRISWRWWWDRSSYERSNFLSSKYSQRITSAKVNTVNGKASWKLKLERNWGRYFIRVSDPVSGHSSGQIFYLSWPGWRSSVGSGELDGASMLSFFAEKDKYTAGENVKVTIPTTAAGRALVTLENGSSILDTFWIETKEGKTEFDFKATSAMTPNIYIHITYLQPYEQTKNDLPIRLYGVIPITVLDEDTVLHPQIEIADTLAPEKKVSIKVKEQNGRPMAYTVAVVDEGLLDITNFTTPDAHRWFYAKEALGVKSWDVYNYILGALADNFGPLLAIGGGGGLQPPKVQKANRFKPVVKVFGPFYMEKDQTKEHTFTMPRYVGSVKTMVVAAHEGAYGKAEATSYVKESVMVLGTMPRVLGPEEKIKLPVNVFVLEKGIKNVKVSVKTEGLLQVTGKSEQLLTFNQEGDQFAYFDLATPAQIGIGKVLITATSGSIKSTYEVEIDVRAPNPMYTEVFQTFLEPGKSWNKELSFTGVEGTNKQVLEVSFMPPINLHKRLEYLVRYPHGCVEQTTSSVFPQLYLDKLTDLSKDQKEDIQNNINAAIKKLKRFRGPNGGFVYWPGSSQTTNWGTNYAGHFLILARDLGYAVPANMLSSWASYQHTRSNYWKKSGDKYEDMIQAYRLYTLALYGKPNLGAMNRMKEDTNIDFRAKWRLAAAYALLNKIDIAKQIIKSIPMTVEKYRASSFTYGSHIRDKAMILETMVIMKEKAKAYTLVKEISEALGSDNWYSTQTTAYSLLALASFGFSGQDDEKISCNYKLGSNSGELHSNKAFASTEFSPAEGTLTIENSSQTTLYVRLISQGIPLRGKEKEDQNVITMSVTYKTQDGQVISDISKMKQGTDFIVETTIYNTGAAGNLEEMALTQIFPSGWEILNARLTETENLSSASVPEYQDIRDDRVYTYFDLRAGNSKTFKVMINAAYLGEYYLPGTYCEAMYNNEVFSSKSGKVIVIEK